VPGSLPLPGPSTAAQTVQSSGRNVQSSVCASVQSPNTQGEGIDTPWVHNSSNASGLSSLPPTPDGGQPGFIAEARGTSHATTDAPLAASVTSAPASTSAPPPQASKTQTNHQSKRPFFKVEKFDGSTSLDTYLWTFHQLAEYMQWGESDKFINLCTSLDGAAKQVLREMPTGGTTEELQELLQTRFGTTKQAVSFEAKLHACRRKPNESL